MAQGLPPADIRAGERSLQRGQAATATAVGTPCCSIASTGQRLGISTQKTPPGPLASNGLMPSINRSVGPISRADARYIGSNAITGGLPLTAVMVVWGWFGWLLCVRLSRNRRVWARRWMVPGLPGR